MERKRLPSSPISPSRLTLVRLKWLEACSTDPTISATELRFAIQLALRYVSLPKSAKRFDETGIPTAWPSQPVLASDLGCTRQGVGAAARRLAKRGYIKITPGRGRGHSTEYGLIEKGNAAGCLLRKPQKETPRPAKGKLKRKKRQPSQLHHSNQYQSKETIQSLSGGDLLLSSRVGKVKGKVGKHPEFEEICRMWPNPDIDKDKAMGAWVNNVLARRVPPAVVLRAARKWCAFWKEEGNGFTLFLGKWLAEHKWEDEPDRLRSSSDHEDEDEDDDEEYMSRDREPFGDDEAVFVPGAGWQC